MKRVIACLVGCLMVMVPLSLAGCGESTSSTSGTLGTTSSDTETTSPHEGTASIIMFLPTDLTGNWKQTNPDSCGFYQEAMIEGDAIAVYWVSGDSKLLYWAGSYEAPPAKTEGYYSWVSKNDISKTGSVWSASSEKTKKFTCGYGVIHKDEEAKPSISYKVTTISGTTKKVELKHE